MNLWSVRGAANPREGVCCRDTALNRAARVRVKCDFCVVSFRVSVFRFFDRASRLAGQGQFGTSGHSAGSKPLYGRPWNPKMICAMSEKFSTKLGGS